jgi:apolipoprotein N-acyltransferase
MNGERRGRTVHRLSRVVPQPAFPEFTIHRSSFLIPGPSLRWAAAALSGVLMFACFPRPNWNLMVWSACLPLLATLLSEQSLARAFGLAYLSGAIFLAGSCYWFIEVMQRYGKLSSTLAVGVLVLFVVIFAMFFGLFGLAETWMARRSISQALLLSPFLWVSMEIARTYLITGFPWNLLGYAVSPSGLRQLASVTAVYGLSFLAVGTSALLAGVSLGPRRKAWGIALAGWVALLAVGDLIFSPPVMPPGTDQVYLLQPNVPLDESVLEGWVPWRNREQLEGLVGTTVKAACQGLPTIAAPWMDCSGARTASGPSSPLVIWAENPAPFYFDRDPIFREAMQRMARSTHAYVVFNTVTFAAQDATQPRNSAMVLDPEGRLVVEYDKIHLVPFGEYVPWWAFPGKVGKITSEIGDFVPGSNYQVADAREGKIGVFICYEAIFPQLVRRLVAAGAGVLVNISNDAWYGDSSAAFQHLEMARLRAVENGRFLLRATNDGITAIVDPYGRIVTRLPRHQRLVLAARFDYLGRKTFYTAYGDVFAWLCVAVAAGMLVWRAAEMKNGRATVKGQE